MHYSRRQMMTTAAAGLFSLSLPRLAGAQEKGKFTLAPLPYGFDALEPAIDTKTMEIHYGKHHKAYVDNLNTAVAGTPFAEMSIENLLMNLDKVPEEKRTAVRNNGGGHFNHTLFWSMMSPRPTKMTPALETAIGKSFKDTDALLAALKDAGMKRFGSGWAWLNVDTTGALKIVSTPNQDNAWMDNSGYPLLGVDVWEHAYYLKYQNLRASYLDAFMKLINWEFVSARYEAAMKK